MKKIFILVNLFLIFSAFLSNLAIADVCNRTPQIKEAIEETAGMPCDKITSDVLSSITGIGIQYKKIGALDKQDFLGLTGLKYLSLPDNQITSLPEGVFDGLTELESLWIGGNQLTSLPKGLFKDLKKLNNLDLGSNQLNSISLESIKDLVNLQWLDLVCNNISMLQVDTFHKLKNLKHLRLSGNLITTLPDGLFDGLTNISELYLNNNPFKSLSEGLFDDLKSLRDLDLRANLLTELPSKIFRGMTGLTELNLSENQLNSLPAGLFDDLKSLSSLYLIDNLLTVLPTGSFKGLTSLQHLYLLRNQISLIEYDVFEVMPGECKFSENILSGIDLRGNPITIFPAYKFSTLRNPYQCPHLPLADTDSILDRFFHLTLIQMDSAAPTFTQVEQVVPRLEKAFSRDYLQMQITAHYGFDLIPSLDGSVDGLNIVRQLAIDVCELVLTFCPVREEIHQFPKQEHLSAVMALKTQLIAEGAQAGTISKVAELEKALSQMFSRDLDYQKLRERLPEGPLKLYLDQLFTQTSWTFLDIAEASQKIQAELIMHHDEAWMDAYFIPFFKVKSFLIYIFKKTFWSQPAESFHSSQSLHILVTMSHSAALLSEREAAYLNTSIAREDDFKTIIEKAVKWQVKNLEREHFSQVNNSRYNSVKPEFPDPNLMLQPTFEKIVRTSLIAEWDRLR